MERDIESFVNKYNKNRAEINTLVEALKSTQLLEKQAVHDLPDGTSKEVTSIFDGSKVVYRASTNGKNVMHFTSTDQVKDYLEK